MLYYTLLEVIDRMYGLTGALDEEMLGTPCDGMDFREPRETYYCMLSGNLKLILSFFCSFYFKELFCLLIDVSPWIIYMKGTVCCLFLSGLGRRPLTCDISGGGTSMILN
jgi:hypothetical protein